MAIADNQYHFKRVISPLTIDGDIHQDLLISVNPSFYATNARHRRNCKSAESEIAGATYRTDGAMLAIGTTPNPAARTLKLCRSASANIWNPSSCFRTGSPIFKTKKAKSSIRLNRSVLALSQYSHKGNENKNEVPGLMARKQI